MRKTTTPPPRLRNHAIGDTVFLKGAESNHDPLLLLEIDDEGYRLLWRSLKRKQDGFPYDVAAAGSHQVWVPA